MSNISEKQLMKSIVNTFENIVCKTIACSKYQVKWCRTILIMDQMVIKSIETMCLHIRCVVKQKEVWTLDCFCYIVVSHSLLSGTFSY